MLYQAGASGPGKAFAAGHAECVFVGAPLKSMLKAYVADVRAKAVAAGRSARDVLIYNLTTVHRRRDRRGRAEEVRGIQSLYVV